MINISKRLKTIAKIILSKESNKIIDVGCDHALLDIYLLQNNDNLRIIASDNKRQPLENARKNIEKYSFLNNIELCLKNGLETLDKDVDTVVISGMGANNIIDILNNNKEELNHVNRLIISSNNKYELLRKEVIKLGYYINDEKLIFDDKYYIIIEFIKGKKKYSKKELFFGPILLENKNNIFYDYYGEIRRKNEIIKNNASNINLKDIDRILNLLYDEKI